ncbi:MAG: nitroreductase [Candidatus Woesearchaeota archaeon]|jgi:nitroreductase
MKNKLFKETNQKYAMDLDDAVFKRRSIRKYLTIPVEKEKWSKVLHAAVHAPSAGNIQNWRIIVVRDKLTIQKIANMCHKQVWMEQAPLMFVICADVKIAQQFYGIRGDRLYSIQNCAAAAQNMLLKATDLGLGACWVSAFEEARLKILLDIPDHIRPQSIITLGYPDEVVPEPAKCTLREIVCFDVFGKLESEEFLAIHRLNPHILLKKTVHATKQLVKDIKEKVKK